MKFIFIHSTDDQQSASSKLDSLAPEFVRIDTGLENSCIYVNEADDRTFLNESDSIGVIQGYVRYRQDNRVDIKDDNRDLFRELIAAKFPLADDTCNSFAAFAFSRERKEVALANDVVGFYPLYYYRDRSTLIVCSHLLLLGRVLDCEIDYNGVTQRLTGPEYCNFGSRTILKDVFRLLPGEYIKFDLTNTKEPIRKYDNSLFAGEFNTNLHEAAQKVWDVIKEESRACFRYDKEIAIAMSGGMDSRILLASLPEEKKITCHTYGSERYYETKIAERCANAIGAEFHSYSEETVLFPEREILKRYVLETEAVGINQWLSILENVSGVASAKIPMAIGESTEAIAGRNIKAYASRDARIRAFLGIKKISWTPLTDEAFESWKQKKTRAIVDRISVAERQFDVDRDRIISETTADLESLYRRIADHDIKYVELLDELFGWYTHARIPISNQLLLLRSKFFPVCPTMSARCVRAISTVHPSLRLNSTLMDEIFRTPDLKRYSAIPTAQIPFIKYDVNEKVKLLVWGIRSKTDQLLMKVASLRKKAHGRNRVLRSTNWALAYHNTDPKIVRSWFSPDFVGGDTFVKTFDDRASQQAHPLIPFDIVSAAGVNMEIDFIKSNEAARAVRSVHAN